MAKTWSPEAMCSVSWVTVTSSFVYEVSTVSHFNNEPPCRPYCAGACAWTCTHTHTHTQWNIIQPQKRKKCCHLQYGWTWKVLCYMKHQTETGKYYMISLICRICEIQQISKWNKKEAHTDIEKKLGVTRGRGKLAGQDRGRRLRGKNYALDMLHRYIL